MLIVENKLGLELWATLTISLFLEHSSHNTQVVCFYLRCPSTLINLLAKHRLLLRFKGLKHSCSLLLVSGVALGCGACHDLMQMLALIAIGEKAVVMGDWPSPVHSILIRMWWLMTVDY